MTVAPQHPTVERPGERAFLHWTGAFIFFVPIGILAVMLYVDHEYHVLDAIPLRHHPSPPFIDFLLVGTVGFPLGVGGFLIGLRDVWQAMQSASWPTVPGKVLTSEVEHTFGKGPHFRAVVRFEYVVDGRRYEGSTIHFSQRKFRFASTAEDVIGRYPVGGEVSVHCDPADPVNAVLETTRADAYRTALWSLGWILLPFFAYFQFFRDIIHG